MVARSGVGEGFVERLERAAEELGDLVPRLELAVERLEPTDAISIPEAARRLSVHRDTIYKLIDRGQLDRVDVASAPRITTKSLHRLLNGDGA